MIDRKICYELPYKLSNRQFLLSALGLGDHPGQPFSFHHITNFIVAGNLWLYQPAQRSELVFFCFSWFYYSVYSYQESVRAGS
jgi:hypothetical protein